MKKLIIAASVAAGMSSTAFAADLDTEVVDPVFGWGGFYAGAAVGFGRLDFDRETGPNSGNVTSQGDANGAIFGAFLGYNWQVNRLVFGIEGDIEISGISGDDGDDPAFLIKDEIDIETMGSIRGRVGYAFDRSLVYATAGWAFAKADFIQTGFGPASVSSNHSLNGWTAGAGVEHAFRDNLLLRLEYRYTDLDDSSFPENGPTSAGSYHPEKFHAVRLGLAYKF